MKRLSVLLSAFVFLVFPLFAQSGFRTGAKVPAITVETARERVAEKVAQLRKQGVVFPVGLDPYEKISQLLGDERIPQLVIIGPDTRVRYHEVGYTPERLDEAAEIIEKLLNEQP